MDSTGSFPGTREIIRELVLEDRIPIAATNRGYFVVETEDELAAYIENLEDRILGISERKFAIRRAAASWEGELRPSEDADLL